ncbi:hypothetical protein ILUMI_11460 [Ignelater luminosus]|uniref:Cytochrome P450 n=1 Tax=Ignelater luminosus TaxID=2038154 RepID=A0A8K0D4Y8_IGNLU|nr:hypothetical protein ILUMI_11460 [Ignelater luminosus]
MIRDPELIKQITVKDFDVFPEHQPFVPEGVDSLWEKNLFAITGSAMRATFSPSFTSSKMRTMFGLMKECSKQIANHFLKQGTVTIDAKNTYTKLTNDVIGTTAFGVTCDSFENPENEFYKMGQKLTDFSGLRAFIFFAYGLSPTLRKLFKIRVIQESVSNFFRRIIKEALDIRKVQGVVRPDMIHLLMEAQKGRLKYDDRNSEDSSFAVVEESELERTETKKVEITDEDITAQAMVFFLAGFETVSTLMSYMSYELAVNAEIQERLINDIDTTREECNGDITYEALMGIKYLDMVVTETLRKWPPLELADRNSVRDYVIEPKSPDEKTHPQYYPNHDKFDPERFSDENKNNIKPFTYLPFGVVPRVCIGSRFALLETKLCMFEILSKFEIVPVEKTQIPLVLRKGSFNMKAEKASVLTIIVLAILIYFKIIKPQNYWEEKGAPYVKPWPVVGNMGPLFFNKKSMAEIIQDIYNAFPEKRCVGFYESLQPILMIRDPELIKQITVKDFEVFPEHQPFVPEGVDSLWEKNLFAIKGSGRWHDMRATLSPSFTSSKMKAMFNLMKDCSKQVTNHFLKQNGIVTIDTKLTFTKFTNDVIGTTAFGVTCDSFANPENEFYKMGQKVTDFSGFRALIFLAYGFSPALMKVFKITVIQENVANFFRRIVKEALSIRKEKGIVRPDMIHLLMEAQKGRLKHDEQSSEDSSFAVVEESELGRTQKRKIEITDEDITAQAVVFFVAGFDTASTLMGFMCYELAVNPDIQQRLIDDVDASLEKCNGDVTYEALMGMKYLDMVVSETLRKWSPAETTDRNSVRDYVIEPTLPGERPVHVDVNTSCWIPIYAIHRDPKYYPNPDKFDPERFSDENKNDIKPFTYLPFGVGPRSCIGSRFALLETKLCMFEILSKFEIVPVEKTQIPLVLRKGTFNMQTEKGIWLGLKPRDLKQCVDFHQSLRPILMLKDLELLKQIAVKDFDTFPEHPTFLPEGADSNRCGRKYIGKNPKKKKIKVTDEDITAHAVVAGYDTTAATLALMSYKLALNPDIQLPGEKPVYVEVNTSCWIPIYALHRDPQYYPNPDKFDPERFSDENKNDIKPFTYLPFGAGSRGCVAFQEIKLCVVEILSKFEIVPVKKTQIPLVLRKGPWPIVGNMGPVIFRKCSLLELTSIVYNSFPKERYFGIYQFLQPTLVIRDPELIKRIAVKDFETFPEHRTFVPEDVDPLFAKNLFSLSGGEKWHNMRATLSPSFTSSKMKMMFGLMTECAVNFVKYFEKQNKGIINVEMKNAFSRFTNDVIGSTAFGITCNSLENPKNEFYLMGKSASNFSGLKSLKVFFYTISPVIMKFFRISILSKSEDNFFRKLIKETLDVRIEKQIIRPDMINLLMEARKGKLKYDEDQSILDAGYAVVEESTIGRKQKGQNINLSDEDITAQALIFFLAGFDTSSTAMCFATYELALNPDIQERLRKEVDAISNDKEGLTYETLLGMKYMDLVITETLRKWPPITFTDRKSIRPFTIEPELPWEEVKNFDKGTICWIPIYPLHRDPKYYPNPEKFDPERFNNENKSSISPFTYLPFGVGPRGCIGSRFALLEVKLILFHILKKFEIVPIEKTKIPLVISKTSLFPAAEGGFWLGLKPRKATI